MITLCELPQLPRTGQNTCLAAQKRLVLDPVGLGGLGAEALRRICLVLVVVALEPDDFASRLRRPGCGSRSGRGTSGRADHHARSPRSPGARPRARAACRRRGRWSARRAAAGCRPLKELRQVEAVALAARELADALLLVGAVEVERRRVGARFDLALAELDAVLAAGDLLPDRRSRDRGRRAPGRRRRAPRSSPIRSSPASGVSSPVIMRKSVVLPAPFGPITPTMPPGGSGTKVVHQQVVAVALAQTARPRPPSPSRGPGGMWISTRVELDARPRRRAALVGASAPCSWRGARGATSAPTRARGRASRRRGLLLLLDGEPCCFCSSHDE